MSNSKAMSSLLSNSKLKENIKCLLLLKVYTERKWVLKATNLLSRNQVQYIIFPSYSIHLNVYAKYKIYISGLTVIHIPSITLHIKYNGLCCNHILLTTDNICTNRLYWADFTPVHSPFINAKSKTKEKIMDWEVIMITIYCPDRGEGEQEGTTTTITTAVMYPI